MCGKRQYSRDVRDVTGRTRNPAGKRDHPLAQLVRPNLPNPHFSGDEALTTKYSAFGATKSYLTH